MSDQGWHPQDILAAVRKRGTTLRALGRVHGFSTNALNVALTKRFPNAHVVIARFLGVSLHELWPHWYDQQNQPRFKVRRDLWRKAGKMDRAA